MSIINKLFNLVFKMTFSSVIRLIVLFYTLHHLGKYPEDEEHCLELMNRIDKELY